MAAAVIHQRRQVEQVTEERQPGPYAELPGRKRGAAEDRRVADRVFPRLDDIIAIGIGEAEKGTIPDTTEGIALDVALDEPEGDGLHPFAQLVAGGSG